MVRGLKDEAAQGGGGSQALWEGEDGTGDMRVQEAERRLCAWNAVEMGTVPGDKLQGEAEAPSQGPRRPSKDLCFFAECKARCWLLGNREA